MAKSPAFQFYAADFLTDTAEMTDQEVGVYIRLLSHQWVNGSINSDPERLGSIATGVLAVWQHIAYKFEEGEDGRLRNQRLEKTRQEQDENREKRRIAGSKGGKAKQNGSKAGSNGSSKTVAKGVAKQVANGSSSSSTSSSINKSSQRKISDDHLKFTKWFFKKIQALNPNTKEPNFERWADTVRLMQERDGRELKEMYNVFRWANKDDFWQVNILSPVKLREQFDQLVIKMNKKKSVTKKTLPADDNQLAAFAAKNGLPSPPQGKTYFEYRQMLAAAISRAA